MEINQISDLNQYIIINQIDEIKINYNHLIPPPILFDIITNQSKEFIIKFYNKILTKPYKSDVLFWKQICFMMDTLRLILNDENIEYKEYIKIENKKITMDIVRELEFDKWPQKDIIYLTNMFY
jgi:hypothetical protein